LKEIFDIFDTEKLGQVRVSELKNSIQMLNM